MNEKKFEKAIDVLLHQQAQLSSGITEIKEDTLKRLNILERVSLNLYDVSVEQGKLVTEQGKVVAEQGKNIAQIIADFAELNESLKETNERLNIVIFMAEKYLGGDGKSNGKSKK